jgi:hypothetical protein
MPLWLKVPNAPNLYFWRISHGITLKDEISQLLQRRSFFLDFLGVQKVYFLHCVLIPLNVIELVRRAYLRSQKLRIEKRSGIANHWNGWT